MPGFGLAAGLVAARTRPGGPVRLRVPGAADLRHRLTGRPVRAGRGLHRSACLGRGLHPGRRLDRDGPDLGPLRRRGSHPALGHPAPEHGGRDHRIHRHRHHHPGVPQRGAPDPRGSARHPAVHPGAVGSRASVGALVDKRLEAGDVRLTMGGEPTFVSIDDGTSAEWTIDADGPKKRERAGVLAERLRRIYAPSGVVHRGQGKWYPGEPLPRWQIAMHWRSDGVPLWTDPALLADPWADEKPADPESADGSATAKRADQDVARRFVTAVAEYFELPASQVRPAYEDALGKLAQQVRMPAGEPVGPPRTSSRTARTRASSCCTSWTSRSPSRAPTCCRCTGCRPRSPTTQPTTRRRHRDDPAARKAAAEHRLGERRLAAPARAHRAAHRGLAGRSAAAAGCHLLDRAGGGSGTGSAGRQARTADHR